MPSPADQQHGFPQAEPPRPRRVLVVMGTRPEAIKLAPLITALKARYTIDPCACQSRDHIKWPCMRCSNFIFRFVSVCRKFIHTEPPRPLVT